MKILVVGSGGREHALTWKISKSPLVTKIFAAPGNAGIAKLAECVDITADNIEGLLAFVKKQAIDLTVVGPEGPLCKGVVNLFQENGLKIFGPSKEAAELEGSKVFCKNLLRRYGIPTANYRVFNQSRAALQFAFVLVVGSFALLWGAANLLCAMLALAGISFYVIVYTMLLKRRTAQNIVWGGAAGCMPVLIGWSAVTDSLAWAPVVLFGVVFFWTPPHFWALALYRVEDYRKSGLPMLPVTHGNPFTRLHVFLYTLVLFAGTLLPFISGMSGPIYLVAAVVLGAMFTAYAWRLWLAYSDTLARKTFRFSIVYLSLLFAALLVDHYLNPLLWALS